MKKLKKKTPQPKSKLNCKAAIKKLLKLVSN